jgi:hypothetical protein
MSWRVPAVTLAVGFRFYLTAIPMSASDGTFPFKGKFRRHGEWGLPWGRETKR